MKLRAERRTLRLAAAPALLVVVAIAGLSAGPAIARDPVAAAAPDGPAADYPMVLGAPFTVDGVTYTPADQLNFDQVGYAVIDSAAGPGITIAHRTLPLPSYAEVTSLRTGKTILVRVERRGPMTGSALVAFSPDAARQLGTDEARTPIRIRRVNPPEQERALLRAGQPAAGRMDTPMPLVGVLMRKLDPSAVPAPVAVPTVRPATPTTPATPATVAPAPVKPAPVKPPAAKPVAAAAPTPAPLKPAAKPAPKPAPASPPPAPAAKGALVVQVGAFGSRANADRVAARVGGTVSPAGSLFRVRIGGLASPDAASAALAKARAAGYSDARIQHAD